MIMIQMLDTPFKNHLPITLQTAVGGMHKMPFPSHCGLQSKFKYFLEQYCML